MFRLHYFEVEGHPKLGDLSIDLTGDQNDELSPYTSVIIGMNGTGKSFILRTISNLFFEIDQLIQLSKRERIPYFFHLRYSIGFTFYDLVSSRLIKEESAHYSRRNIVGIFALKNRPIEDAIFPHDLRFDPIDKYVVDLSEIELPNKVIVSTSQLNDRFIFREDKDSEIYRYCGVRRTAQTISTRSFQRNIVDSLFKASKLKNLNKLLETTIVEYLGFQKHLQVHYRTKYSGTFYKEGIDEDTFRNFYEKWQETTKRNSQPWGTWKYDQLKKNDPNRIPKIIEFIKKILRESLLIHRKGSDSKRYSIDFFDIDNTIDLSLINDLVQLDILLVEKIEIKKAGSKLALAETSAGENQIVMSLLSILSNIEDNSIIFIDEPEISLHPNWQMKYIHLLKNMFSSFPTCHFIIATHSHFLVSDLEPNSSSVSALQLGITENGKSVVNVESLANTSTYGWSAEDVLYNVFKVATTRNYYVAQEIGFILKEIAKKEINHGSILDKHKQLQIIMKSLNDNDPLKSLILKIEKEFLNG